MVDTAGLAARQEERIQRLSKAHDRYYEALVEIRSVAEASTEFPYDALEMVEGIADEALREV